MVMRFPVGAKLMTGGEEAQRRKPSPLPLTGPHTDGGGGGKGGLTYTQVAGIGAVLTCCAKGPRRVLWV